MNFYIQGTRRFEIEKKYREFIHEELNLGKQITYVKNKKMPFLNIFRYKEAFSYDFLKYFFRKCEIGSNDYIFDPFSGLGTTLFASMINGIPSIGIDKLPLAYFLSKTLPKFLLLKKNELLPHFKAIKNNINKVKPADIALDVAIVKKAFDEKSLLELRKVKSAIDNLSQPYRDIFLFLFLAILEDCSFTAKDGQFLRLKKNKELRDPFDAIKDKMNEVEQDLIRMSVAYPELNPKKLIFPETFLGDTRDLSKITFKRKPTAIITSPPYCNRYDYTRTYSLELIFNFIKNFEELKKIRFGILRSHVESKIYEGEQPTHPVISEVVNKLENQKLNNPRLPIMITTYFIDMEKVINEWFKVLANGAKVVMVVDNVRYEGELIPVDLVLTEIAENIGFSVKEIKVARYKGNSSQQMKKYGRVPVRESVVIWEK